MRRKTLFREEKCCRHFMIPCHLQMRKLPYSQSYLNHKGFEIKTLGLFFSWNRNFKESFSIFFSESHRRDPDFPAKNFGKVISIAKTTFKCNFFYSKQ